MRERAIEIGNINHTQDGLRTVLFVTYKDGSSHIDLAILKRIKELEEEKKALYPATFIEALQLDAEVEKLEKGF